MRSRHCAALAAVFLALLSTVASAGEPRGAEFGNNSWTTAIVDAGGEPDTDDYVAALTAGDALSVSVSAASKSALKPHLALVAPDGSALEVPVTVRGGGRSVALKSFVATATGRWGVRVTGGDATSGAYSIKFHITPAKSVRLTKQVVGGGTPATASHAIEAVDGSALSLTIKSSGSGEIVTLLSVTGPDGPVEIPAESVITKKTTVTVKDLPLTAGTGTYVVGVGTGGATGGYSISIAAVAPKRLTGKRELSSDEPLLAPRAVPFDGTGDQLVRFTGVHFSTIPPYSKVWIGGKPAGVISTGGGGSYLDVVPPVAPGDTIADVTVQNIDGQTTTQTNYFHYLALGPLDVASIEPSNVVLAVGDTQKFVVTLTRLAAPPGIDVVLDVPPEIGTSSAKIHVPGNSATAEFQVFVAAAPAKGKIQASFAGAVAADVEVVPRGAVANISPAEVTVTEKKTQTFTVNLASAAPTAGLDVALTIPPYVGTGPSKVHIGGGKSSGTFVLTGGPLRSTGTITATLEGNATSNVTILPPTSVDVSGWTIVQTSSAMTYTIPQGVVLNEGDCIVVGRNATESQFVGAWAVTFDSRVHYLNGGNFPDVNGYESMQLKDSNGVSVDGPTILMAANGGYTYVRTPGAAANVYASWLAYAMTGFTQSLPGTGVPTAPSPPGIYITKFSDSPNGSYDFVEIFFDRLP